jgi:hypothetical protein
MTAALLAVLLACPLRAETPQEFVARFLTQVDVVVADEAGKDAGEIALKDRRIRAMAAELAPLGERSAAPLGKATRDVHYAAKTRLFATTFLIRVAGAAGADELGKILLDETLEDDIRRAAAQGLISVDAPADKSGLPLCTALGQKSLPRAVLDDVLVGAERLGCFDPDPLEGRARAYGARPAGTDLTTVRRVVATLQKSPGPVPLKSLLHLAAYFPARGDARAAVLAALAARKAEVASRVSTQAYAPLLAALREESGRRDSMLSAVDLIDAFGPEADAALLPLAQHRDAEVLAEAAEALARRRAVKALPDLERVIGGALHDERFAPAPGRVEPARLLSRIETAAAALRQIR